MSVLIKGDVCFYEEENENLVYTETGYNKDGTFYIKIYPVFPISQREYRYSELIHIDFNYGYIIKEQIDDIIKYALLGYEVVNFDGGIRYSMNECTLCEFYPDNNQISYQNSSKSETKDLRDLNLRSAPRNRY